MSKILAATLLLVCGTAFGAVEVKDGKVTANLQSEPLRNVVTQIGQQAGVEISIDNEAANEMIYANFQDLPIGAAIRKLLEGTGINFAVVSDPDGSPMSILISKSQGQAAPPKKLDTRPVMASPNRGIVTPVSPAIPQPNNPIRSDRINQIQQQQQQMLQQQKEAAGDQKSQNPYNSGVPTAGSFNPSVNQNPAAQPNRNDPKQDAGEVNPNDEDDSDDEDEE